MSLVFIFNEHCLIKPCVNAILFGLNMNMTDSFVNEISKTEDTLRKANHKTQHKHKDH